MGRSARPRRGKAGSAAAAAAAPPKMQRPKQRPSKNIAQKKKKAPAKKAPPAKRTKRAEEPVDLDDEVLDFEEGESDDMMSLSSEGESESDTNETGGAQPSVTSMRVATTRVAPAGMPPSKWAAPRDAAARVAAAVHGVASRAEWRGLTRPPRLTGHYYGSRTGTGGTAAVAPRAGAAAAVPARTYQPSVVPLVPSFHLPHTAKQVSKLCTVR
eukprot:COSAG02_NODE_444_length_22204_cov_21.041167_1_plen_213_part_00